MLYRICRKYWKVGVVIIWRKQNNSSIPGWRVVDCIDQGFRVDGGFIDIGWKKALKSATGTR